MGFLERLLVNKKKSDRDIMENILPGNSFLFKFDKNNNVIGMWPESRYLKNKYITAFSNNINKKAKRNGDRDIYDKNILEIFAKLKNL